MITNLPIEIIKLEDASYHLMIEVIFNKNVNGNLIIDTGASKTVFDQTFVNSFIVDMEDIDEQNSSGINAMITNAKLGTIPNLSFGKLQINNYQSLLLDLSHINKLYKKYTNKQIAGLLGSDFLMDYNAVIDFGKKKIFFTL